MVQSAAAAPESRSVFSASLPGPGRRTSGPAQPPTVPSPAPGPSCPRVWELGGAPKPRAGGAETGRGWLQTFIRLGAMTEQTTHWDKTLCTQRHNLHRHQVALSPRGALWGSSPHTPGFGHLQRGTLGSHPPVLWGNCCPSSPSAAGAVAPLSPRGWDRIGGHRGLHGAELRRMKAEHS